VENDTLKHWTIDRLKTAAEKGQLEIIKWFLETVGFDPKFLPTEICREAAQYGHLEVLKYLRSREAQWSESVCWAAAEGDHLAVLQWCRQNGAPWSTAVVANARSVELLQWALDHGVPLLGNERKKN